MIHHVYVGHFAREGDFIRFEKPKDTKPVWYRPAVLRRLDPMVIAELLTENGITDSSLPDDWGVSFEEGGFIACDRHTRSGAAKDFIQRLAKRAGCDIADYSSLSLVSPDDLRQAEPIGRP